jgi:hypothetical protein
MLCLVLRRPSPKALGARAARTANNSAGQRASLDPARQKAASPFGVSLSQRGQRFTVRQPRGFGSRRNDRGAFASRSIQSVAGRTPRCKRPSSAGQCLVGLLRFIRIMPLCLSVARCKATTTHIALSCGMSRADTLSPFASRPHTLA